MPETGSFDSVDGFAIKRFVAWCDGDAVYAAFDPVSRRPVQVRVLDVDPDIEDEDEAAAAGRRFLRLAATARGLRHPHVAEVLASGSIEGQPYVVREWVDGGSLADGIDGKPLPERRALGHLLQAAAGLAAAHRVGLFHERLGPASLLVTPDGVTKVADFGLGPVLVPDRTDEGAAADVYDLGAVFFHLLSGRPLPKGPRPRLIELRPKLTSRFCAVVERMLAPSPGDRFQDCEEILRRLEPVRVKQGVPEPLREPVVVQAPTTPPPVVDDVVPAAPPAAAAVVPPPPAAGSSWPGVVVTVVCVLLGVMGLWWAFEGQRPVVAGPEPTRGLAVPEDASPSDARIVPLPGSIADIVLGGRGRRLVASLRGLPLAVVIDVVGEQTVRSIRLDSADCAIAAGADDVFAVDPQGGVVGYSLAQGEEVRRGILIGTGTAFLVRTGWASSGPLFVGWTDGAPANTKYEFRWYDAATFALLDGTVRPDAIVLDDIGTGLPIASADGAGTRFVVADRRHPAALVVGPSLEDEVLHLSGSPWYVAMAADGDYVLHAGGYTACGQGVSKPPVIDRSNLHLPTPHPDLFLRVGDLDVGGIPRVVLASLGTSRSLGELATLPELPRQTESGTFPWRSLAADRRMFLLPDCALLVTVPLSNDRLVVRRVTLP